MPNDRTQQMQFPERARSAQIAWPAGTGSEGRVVDTAGLPVFTQLIDAIRAGYHVVDGTPDGYVVRIRTFAGWTRAFVKCR